MYRTVPILYKQQVPLTGIASLLLTIRIFFTPSCIRTSYTTIPVSIRVPVSVAIGMWGMISSHGYISLLFRCSSFSFFFGWSDYISVFTSHKGDRSGDLLQLPFPGPGTLTVSFDTHAG
jgi:hypothetical protein